MYEFALGLLFLAAYSFLGWIAEVGFVLLADRRLENRGFLTGPFVPIYGFGALALIYFVSPYVQNPFLVFVASVLVSSVLEYVTHFALDKIFHIKLWDYSGQRFNIRGRVCLRNSLLFGMLGLLLFYVVHPVVNGLLVDASHDVVIGVGWALFGTLMVDAANSVRSLSKVRPVLDDLNGTLKQAHDHVEEWMNDRHSGITARRTVPDLAHLGTLKRLARAFPAARSARRMRDS